MHLLTTSSTGLDEIVEAVDLGQPPGDIAILSFADSDLSGLAAAWQAERDALPSVRLAHLRDLRHPMSVDLWIDRVGARAKVILVRLLGGLDWWKYGIERLSALARERGIALAVLPGEDRDDSRLAAASTLPRRTARRIAALFPRRRAGESARPVAPAGAPCRCGSRNRKRRSRCRGLPVICRARARSRSSSWWPRSIRTSPWCRSSSTAPCCSPPTPRRSTCCATRSPRAGWRRRALIVTSLKDREAAPFLRGAFAKLDPALIVTTTAFAAGGAGDEPTALDEPGVPVLQVVSATTKRAAWRDSPRGLGAADLAMHIVLPELDGRVLAGAIAFKDPLPPHEGLGFHRAGEPARAGSHRDGRGSHRRARSPAHAAAQRAARRHPDAGLSRRAGPHRLRRRSRRAGKRDRGARRSCRRRLRRERRAEDVARFARCAVARLRRREAHARAIRKSAGATAGRGGRTLARSLGRTRERSRRARRRVPFSRRNNSARFWSHCRPIAGAPHERRADYHDPALPPRHALVAFGLWLQHVAKVPMRSCTWARTARWNGCRARRSR